MIFIRFIYKVIKESIGFMLFIALMALMAIPYFFYWLNEKLDPTTPEQKWKDSGTI